MAILQRDVRASDGDREQAVAQLKAHYAAGRLAHTELATRTHAAYSAVGMRELQWLLSDLPGEIRRPRRRRRPMPVWPFVALAVLLVAWLSTVPAEVTVALVAVFVVMALLAVVLLAPIWIPVLLAFAAYRLLRSR